MKISFPKIRTSKIRTSKIKTPKTKAPKTKAPKVRTLESERKKKNRRKVLRHILIAMAAVMLLGMLTVGGFILVQIAHAPDISQINAAPGEFLTVILDNQEERVDSLYVTESNRISVELEDTPIDLQHAFVAIEDARFYKHHGIDPKGIARAAIKGIMKGGKFSEGASTITQQLLKNNVFEGWMKEDGLMDRVSRKIHEQYLALQLEKAYDKDWILENYMNTINLGGGTRGVQVAAHFYFGKDVSQLSLAECALIAGITKNPSGYNPKKNPDKSLERQHLVLSAMKNQGYITEAEYQDAREEDVLANLSTSESQSGQIFSWFEDALLESIVADMQDEFGYTREEAWNQIYSGGLTIHSTLDQNLQKLCEDTAANPTYTQDKEEASIVMMDKGSGAVAAIVGGRERKTTSLAYNRATSSVRQPGSTIKMIGEYAAAMNAGQINLGTVIDDAAYSYSDGTPIHNASGRYEGMTTIRDAISSSCNVIALKTFQQAGQQKVIDTIHDFGITTLDEKDYYEALSIGGTYNGVTNLELTAAYNAIASDGIYNKPYYYTTIEDHKGNVILENKDTNRQVISADAAGMLTMAMEDVISRGTGSIITVNSSPVAGKSGTTNSNKDTWFVGFSNHYSLGVWCGNDDNSPQKSSRTVKLLWGHIMQEAHRGISGCSSEKLVDTSRYVSANICTKCGKRAVAGLCDSTLQGNMTRSELFPESALPSGYCSCHIRLTLCTESHQEANTFCPYGNRKTGIYLVTATAGTADEAYCAGDGVGSKCTIHTMPWNYFNFNFWEW